SLVRRFDVSAVESSEVSDEILTALERVFASTPALVAVVTPSGATLHANRAAPPLPLDVLARVASTRTPESFDASAGAIAYQLTVSALDDARLLVVGVDVTARKKLEERL